MNRLYVSIGVDGTYHGRDRASPNGFSISDITCQPWILMLAVGDAYVCRAIGQPEEHMDATAGFMTEAIYPSGVLCVIDEY